MSLRHQTVILLIGLSIAFVISTYAVQVLVVMPAFAVLEKQAAQRDVDRCIDAINRDLEGLSNTANDWASWDDSYQYVEDHNEAFAKGNLIDEAFSNTHINLICILDKQRRIVWGESHDMETLEAIEVPDLFTMLQEEGHPVTTHTHIDDARQGILLTSKGPILLASRPIVTTKREGPIRGSVVMGRFLSEQEIASLAERTHVSLNLWAVNQPELPLAARHNLAVFSGIEEKLIDVVDAKTLHAYTRLNDVNGDPAMLLRVNVPRDVTQQGSVSAYMATGCSIAGGVCALLAIGIVLQKRIVGPLQQMAAHAVRVGKQDDLKARLNLSRNDEIGTLASEFDSMVQNLADTRRKVLDSAHRAGMAEIASEVLHNVGNTVNSANCSIEMLEDQFEKSKLSGLAKATTLLQEQAPRAAEFFSQDPRGPKLISYLLTVNDALQQERTDNQAEVTRLRGTIRHIRDAIAAQQTFAGRSDFRQDVELADLIETVMGINQELVRSSETQVTIDLPPLPELQLNKSKMTQVLVNLVRNAIQAMQEVPSDRRHLRIAASCVEDNGIEIEIADTGSGFNEELKSKLFTHGFTTKLEGNGFGLHYCANAIRESGGNVSAHSCGPGQGASFCIRLPRVMPTAANSLL